MKQEINGKEYVMGQAATAGAFHYDVPTGEARTMSALEARTLHLEETTNRAEMLRDALRNLVVSLNPDAFPPKEETTGGVAEEPANCTRRPPHLDRLQYAIDQQTRTLDDVAALIDILRLTVG